MSACRASHSRAAPAPEARRPQPSRCGALDDPGSTSPRERPLGSLSLCRRWRRYTEDPFRRPMQRILSFVLFVAFVAGPALNLRCWLSCAPLHSTAMPARSCNHSTDSEQAISPAADCGIRLSAPALASKRVSLTLFSFVVTSQPSLEPQTYSSVESRSISTLSTSPALASLLIPLRI
jgi:hypothetical protein